MAEQQFIKLDGNNETPSADVVKAQVDAIRKPQPTPPPPGTATGKPDEKTEAQRLIDSPTATPKELIKSMRDLLSAKTSWAYNVGYYSPIYQITKLFSDEKDPYKEVIPGKIDEYERYVDKNFDKLDSAGKAQVVKTGKDLLSSIVKEQTTPTLGELPKMIATYAKDEIREEVYKPLAKEFQENVIDPAKRTLSSPTTWIIVGAIAALGLAIATRKTRF